MSQYLPNEILVHIFDFLPVQYQMRLSRVCWQWHDILIHKLRRITDHINVCMEYPQISQFAIGQHKQEFKRDVDELLRCEVVPVMTYYNISGSHGIKSFTVVARGEKLTILNDLGVIMIKTWKIGNSTTLMDKIRCYPDTDVVLNPQLVNKEKMELIVKKTSEY